MNRTIEIILSSIFSIFTYLIGGFDSLFITLLILIVIDYITGICKAIYKKELSSKISLKGIIKKFGYICIIILSTVVDLLINDENMALRSLMIYFFIANEGISILENWSLIGLPLPKKIFDFSKNYKKTNKNCDFFINKYKKIDIIKNNT